MKIRINDIIINKRIRQGTGDLSQLKSSMATIGLLNPIIINTKNELIAGYRRLQAAKDLNWELIECRIIDTKTEYEKLVLEAEENLGRKDFTEEELSLYQSQKEYLSATGIKKFKLVILRFLQKIKSLIKDIFK